MTPDLTALFKTDAVRSPWPVAIDGSTVSDGDLGPCAICQKRCSQMDCLRPAIGSGPHKCPHGMTYYQLTIADQTVVVYGIVTGSRQQFAATSWLKNSVKGRSASPSQVANWSTSLQNLVSFIDEHSTSQQREMLAGLHDTNRWAREMFRAAERVVWDDHSRPFREAFDAASTDKKTVYKAARILLDTFDFVTIYANPEAARFDDKKSVDLYKLIDKIRIILNFTRKGDSRERIRMYGTCNGAFRLYETFKLVPFALLDNAQKYCLEGEVAIHVEETPEGADIRVCTVGPLIPAEDIPYLFTKGFRSDYAKLIKDRGTGIGLYVAQIVAEAHRTRITAESRALNRSTKKEIPLAENTFRFVIPHDTD